MVSLDLKDQKFGRLNVLKRLKSDKWRDSRWLCKCACGTIIKTRGSSLQSGHTKSCGCLQKEIVSNACFKHGHAVKGHTTKTYSIWMSMLDRCRNPKNPNYKHYGGRGIEVCERWMEFRNFLEDIGEKPIGKTLERENNDKGYDPHNCNWATMKEQARNRRNNKLTILRAQVIKKLLKESSLTQEDIAGIFEVTGVTISNIKIGKTWSDINY